MRDFAPHTLLRSVILFLGLVAFEGRVIAHETSPACSNMNPCPECPDEPFPDGEPGCPPILGTAVGMGSSSVADPIDLTRGGMVFEEYVDLSIPVRHGLSLQVRRGYSDWEFDAANYDGDVALGYSSGGDAKSNWHLQRYESRMIFPIHVDNDFIFIWQEDRGNWIHFAFAEDFTADDSDMAYEPDSALWGSSVDAARYFPNGDPRGSVVGVTGKRQTTRDLEMIVLYDERPDYGVGDQGARMDPANILGIVVRDLTTGEQYHYECGADGQTHLRFYDANFRNNVEDSEDDHVDDYLEVTWKSVYSAGSSSTVLGIDRVYAPPTDGRYLIFRHPSRSGSPSEYAHVASVDLVAGATTYDDLIRYEYHTSGAAPGKLKLAILGNDSDLGAQYDYGEAEWNTTTEDFDVMTTGGKTLVRISKVTDIGTSDTLRPLVVFERGVLDEQNFVAQWSWDPGIEDWSRIVYAFTGFNGASFGFGETKGGDTRFCMSSPSATETYCPPSLLAAPPTQAASFNYHHDPVESDFWNNTTGGIPSFHYVYQENWLGPTRLVEKKYLRVAAGGHVGFHPVNWGSVLVEEYEFALVSGEEAGIDRPTKITRYTEYEAVVDGGVTKWKEVEETKQETFFEYDDADFPQVPSEIRFPDGRRVQNDYDTKGRLVATTDSLLNRATDLYEFVSSTTYEYHDTGSQAGLLENRVFTPAVGPVERTHNYIYSTKGVPTITVNYRNGMVLSLLVETHDNFGNRVYSELNQTGFDDIVTSALYSGPGQSDTHVPPRVIATTDAAGSVTTYAYDDENHLIEVEQASGTGLARATTYAYDVRGYMIETTAPGVGTTEYTYDVYGHLARLTDPDGNVTDYRYDEYGRLAMEAVQDGEDTLYFIRYSYSAGGGSSCGSCGGGGQDLIASRTIFDGEDEEEENGVARHYKYDLIGRLTWEGPDPDGDPEVTYEYDGTDLARIVHHGALWADGEFEFAYDDLGRLAHEEYPDGRRVEYAWDAAGRLGAVKDPFGFVTALDYDTTGRLATVDHSTLGMAGFEYRRDDRLTTMVLGNGAKALYGYDDIGRLTSVDHEMAVGTRLVKHAWEYDELSRKSDIEFASAVTELAGITDIDLTYDDASRLIRERIVGGATTWDAEYAYSDGGNRTDLEIDGTDAWEFTYGAGNRESDVDPGDGLVYDFRGNVTSRTPLGGGSAVTYGWDERDRLTTATLTGVEVGYAYDAGGRLLQRVRVPDEGSSETLRLYYVGLNRIAEEVGGIAGDAAGVPGIGAARVFRASEELEDDPIDDGWFDGVGTDTLEYVNDAERGKVLRGAGTGFFGRGIFGIGDDFASPENPNDEAFDTANAVVQFWFKNDYETEDEVTFLVTGRAPDGDPFTVRMHADDGTDTGGLADFDLYLGAGYNDGEWHFVEVDLRARIAALDPDSVLAKVDVFGMLAEDARVDDLVLATGRLRRSYAVNPLAALGPLGAQSGADGGDCTEVEAAWSRWYYHLNDLYTVVATTDADGAMVGAYAPDFHGNYRTVAGGRPDSMGLTTKFFDTDGGLYYFGARWLDADRGQFVSTCSQSRAIEHPYGYAMGVPCYGLDPDGNFPWLGCLVGAATNLFADWMKNGNWTSADVGRLICKAVTGCVAGAIGGGIAKKLLKETIYVIGGGFMGGAMAAILEEAFSFPCDKKFPPVPPPAAPVCTPTGTRKFLGPGPRGQVTQEAIDFATDPGNRTGKTGPGGCSNCP